MKTRIEKLMRSEGLTSVKLAELLSVQPSNISHIMSGRNNPSYDLIVKIIERFPNVNPEWLLLGKGGVYKCKIDESTPGISIDKSLLNTEVNPVKSESATLDYSVKNQPLIEIDTKTIPIVERHNSPPGDFTNILASDTAKAVKKIIFIYSDNTFEIFNNG